MSVENRLDRQQETKAPRGEWSNAVAYEEYIGRWCSAPLTFVPNDSYFWSRISLSQHPATLLMIKISALSLPLAAPIE